MYRFLLRPAWIGFHLLVIGAIVLMTNLGFWQLRRLDERRDFNARVEARADVAPVAAETLLGVPVDEIDWRPVMATGQYLPDEQVVVFNRSQNGRAGENVVTPFVLADGTVLLVNRGFVPLGEDAAAPPDGRVTVTGLVRASQERRPGQLADPAEGELTEVQRIDIERLAPQLPGDVAPFYVDLVGSEPAEAEPYPEPVEPPELTEGPHLSYAVQWFIFSAAVLVGWVLAVRHSVGKRRAALTERTAAPEDGDRPPSGAGERATATP